MNNRRIVVAMAAGAALAMGAPALANDPGAWDPALDIVFDLDPFTVEANSGGAINVESFDLGSIDGVVGFSFSGDATGQGVNITWASDTLMRVYLDGNEVHAVGGISTGPGGWDFQGSQSTGDGFYAHGLGGEQWDGDGKPDFGISGSGMWTFTFEHDWHSNSAAPITWEAQIIIHRIPAPGALALLGIAGLIGTRRRR